MTCGTLGIISDLKRHACPLTLTSSSFSPKFTIQWQADSSCTQRVIDHLHSNPVDCRVLFFLDGKQLRVEGDHPSGKDKLAICLVIAMHIFKNDHDLKKSYWECYDKLHSSGAGVMPDDDAENLHATAQGLQMFPWYNKFTSIVGTNPALSVKTILVHPSIDHAANFFAVTQAGWTSGSDSESTQLVPPSSHIAPPPPSSHMVPPGSHIAPPPSSSHMVPSVLE
ncbi:hypothetical protein BDR03DRAFT_986203 [Suillus americanus]|nr:hypothetical protein BDR03DRAFT_986203 [Suillus americanus]